MTGDAIQPHTARPADRLTAERTFRWGSTQDHHHRHGRSRAHQGLQLPRAHREGGREAGAASGADAEGEPADADRTLERDGAAAACSRPLARRSGCSTCRSRPDRAMARGKGHRSIGLSGEKLAVVIIELHRDSEQAKQSALQRKASPEYQRAAPLGVSTMKAIDRLKYCATDARFAGHGHVLESRLDEVVRAVGAIPAPSQDALDGNPKLATPGDATVAGSQIADEIERLAQLHTQGALTDDEFAAAKAKILGTKS